MISKKFTALILTALLLTLCGCGAGMPKQTPTIPEAVNEFNFSVLKVGQADAIIMKTENHCVIIDCGEEEDGDEVVKYLVDNGINNVDRLFITHFDKDHIGGVPKVLDSVAVGEIITPAYEGTNGEYYSYLTALGEHSLTPMTLEDNISFTLDDVYFEVYPPEKDSYAEGDNDFSLAISVTHGGNRFLFTGDAEEERLTEILNQVDGEYDFLKGPHHGRYNKYLKAFFEAVKPVYSIITDSDKNPAEERTVSALEAVGSEIYCTKDGDITVSSDGVELAISQ